MERFAAGIDGLSDSASFADAAQRFCDAFYEAFSDTALVRIFGTVALEDLGAPERRAVAAFV
ncbi:MAG: hypothetical protein IAI50_13320, partial [Candidatus Eremiobacteraeota bacterium]|nr:hypothetical protein [Candidatus Eremiobacteraeota bacterium]